MLWNDLCVMISIPIVVSGMGTILLTTLHIHETIHASHVGGVSTWMHMQNIIITHVLPDILQK